MKNILLSILLLIALVSCKNEKVNYAIISGKILNVASDTAYVSDNLNHLIKKIPIREDASFSDTIYNTNAYFTFSDGNERTSIFLEDGYQLFIKLNTKEFDESLSYTGVGGEVNNYLAQKYLLDEQMGNPKELFLMDEEMYLSKIQSFAKELNNNLNEINASDLFKELEKKNIAYQEVIKLQPYERYHGRLIGDPTFKVSDSFPSLMEDKIFDDENEFKNYAAYQQLASRAFFKKVMDTSIKDSISFPKVAIDEVKKVKSQLMKNNYLKQLSYQVDGNNESSEELYNDIMALTTDEKLKKLLTKKFNLFKSLVKGAASPVFKNYENYQGGKSSLSDYLGKYVYIDVWATWCSPCVAEIPALKELNKQYAEKDIVFLSISIDKKRAHQTWKDMIKEKEMKGVQLFAPNDWSTQFVQDYGISSIPRFILIDKEGKIINSNAPRPSDPNLVKVFDELGI